MARILLAEDDSSLRKFLARALERAGHHVVECDNGDEALAALEQDGFDLLLSDIVMPGADGIEVARVAASRHPGIRIRQRLVSQHTPGGQHGQTRAAHGTVGRCGLLQGHFGSWDARSENVQQVQDRRRKALFSAGPAPAPRERSGWIDRDLPCRAVLRRIACGASRPSGTRTHTGRSLSPLSLPIGVWAQMVRV